MNATTCRTIKDDGSAVAEVSGGDHKSTGEGSSVEKEVSFDVKLWEYTTNFKNWNW